MIFQVPVAVDVIDADPMLCDHWRDEDRAMAVQRLLFGAHDGDPFSLCPIQQALNTTSKLRSPGKAPILYPPVDVAGRVVRTRPKLLTEEYILYVRFIQ